MATVPKTRKDQCTDESDKRQEGEDHQFNEWKEILWIVLVFAGLFALVGWLANMAP